MEPRVLVAVCDCGLNIRGVVDVPTVVAEAAKMPSVVAAEEDKYWCSKPGQDKLKELIQKHEANRVVVAACTPKLHEPTFRRVLEEAGLPFVLEFANIREQCSWVHMHEPTKATEKAIDLVRMGVAKSRLLEPGERIKVPVKRSALVIGGGVAGIRAALDLANDGYEVYLVEREPTIGGHMAQLDKLFPTGDCSICIEGPLMAEVSTHPKIKLYTYAEVKEVSGYVGNFRVRILKKPRYVTEECNACGLCEEICPVRVPNEFDMRIRDRGAIYRPFPQAVPSIYLVDEESCIGCGLCKVVCERDAVDFEQQPVEEEIEVGTIVVATGYEPYDPLKDHDYGYGIYKNVITSLELERMFNAGSPTGGKVLRPSDGKVPQRVAFIQCVGSRDVNKNPYCSVVCCPYALKEARCIKERHPETDVWIFYTDFRVPAEMEEYLEATQRDYGVKLVRGRVAEVYEDPNSGNLILTVEDTVLGKLLELDFDLVILSVGLEPARGVEELARKLRIARSADGFFMPAHVKLKPVDSTLDGIFLAGVAAGPKDITMSSAQGSAAASRASALMAKGEFEMDTLPASINPEKCALCRLCEQLCYYRAVSFDKEKRKMVVNPALCKACGVCAAACPNSAVSIPIFTDEQIMAQLQEALRYTGVEGDLEPRIIAFCCNWCGYAGADHAGLLRCQYPTNVRIIRVMCSGRINPMFIVEAFRLGVDGVMVVACHPPDCHYVRGVKQAGFRFDVLRGAFSKLGLEPERLRFEFVSAVEGPKFANAVREFVEQIKRIGISPIKAEILRQVAGS